MSSFFTQAGNFDSAVSGGVDPRTGLFGVEVTLGSLVGNNNLGPSLPLSLSYSPLNSVDAGFGQGFQLALTTYDTDNRLLALSTGEQYKVLETDTDVHLQQKGLDTVRFTKDDDSYRIVHKSGDVEILTGPDNAYSHKVPTAWVTPSGHRLTFDWNWDAAQPRIYQVHDESGQVLLNVEYFGISKTVLHVLPDLSEAYDVELIFKNELLNNVRLLVPDADPLVWTFSYDDMGEWGEWITGVLMPGGMSETVNYNRDGHEFPDSSSLPKLPYVGLYTLVPGGDQPAIEASYMFSSTNFVGGAYPGATFDSDNDTLYGFETGYTYYSVESRTCGGKTQKVTRTYNSYHLLTDEMTELEGYSGLVHTDYYATVGQSFEQQPPQFQLPKMRTVTWTDAQKNARSEVTVTNFDEQGNPQSRIDPDGARTDWTFYPVDGDGEDCPPDPNGFARWLKDVVRTPPATEFDAPVRKTSYRYKAYATPDPQVTSVVVQSEETEYADGQALSRKSCGYVLSGAEFGRINKLTETEYPDGEGGDSYSSTHAFSFSVDGEMISQSHTLVTYDQLTVTRSQKRSRFTGRLRSAVDEQGVTTALTYDALGRVLSRTSNPDTQYEATENHAYTVGGSAPFQMTSTDPLRNQVRESFDGAGRPILREYKNTGGDWHTVKQVSYDEQGRTASMTVSDYLPDGSRIGQTQTFSYDNWGQQEKSTSSDGAGQSTQTDPVSLTTASQQLGNGTPVTGKTVATCNVRGEPVKVERFDLQGASAGSRLFERDGWGRVRRETDEAGNTTRYDYDVRDRLTRTTLMDGTVTIQGYEPFSSGALAVNLTVNGASYGTQSFDGMGRRTATTSGGRTWSYRYDKASDPIPYKAVMPDLQEVNYQFIPELGNTISQIQTGSITQTITPNPVTGFLTQAQEGDVTITREYTPSGLPDSETTSYSGSPDATASWGFTLGGLEHTHTAVDGTVRKTERDAYARVSAVTDPDMEASLGYDSAGRLSTWTAKDPHTGYALTTTVTPDDFGREKKRTVTDSRGNTWTLAQEWQNNDLITRKTFSYGTQVLRDETFTYTNRNQLHTYTCTRTGSGPVDDHNNQITQQTFTYDAYGNVTQCQSQFMDGGSDTATYNYDNASDPCQLTSITHTGGAYPSQIILAYDAAGRLTTDEDGRTLTYDSLGRLKSAGPANTYGYDPLSRLFTQQTTEHTNVLHYRGETLSTLVEDGQPTRLLQLTNACVAQNRNGQTQLLSAEGNQTPLSTTQDTGDPELPTYTPYGQRPPQPQTSILGYTGQRTDPETGCYHLGNGTRTYNPALLRFHTPDTLSPFGAGGINPYSYCLGDPVNRTDPTGHLSWKALLGIGLGIAGLALTAVTGGIAIGVAGGIGAALADTSAVVVGALGVVSDVTSIASGAAEEASPKASSILGWISLGTGIVGLGAGVATARAAKAASELTEGADRGLALQKGELPKDGGLGLQKVGGHYMTLVKNGTEFDVPVPAGETLKLAQTNPEAVGRPVVLPGRFPRTFQSVTNAEGARVWVSQDPVHASLVREVTADALSRGKQVHILSATHGAELGVRTKKCEEVRFFREDVNTKLSLRTKKSRKLDAFPRKSQSRVVIYYTPEMSPQEIGRVLRQDSSNEIIAAFCFSRNDSVVREYLQLGPTYSYSPFYYKFY
ncbi:RHS repeat-associated core domain-containing protein [Streptomyces sp. PTY087I2]|uniref:RHS repeat-associated core domain-containing protein n=1 Tax=Streptomyces sp. PTY087I2 TaxID=1819298 RepID=UPI00159EDEC5|nr:RHS repeat-associated core domain-containing protein [Streptomyces sp. PTY087I2]